jgi:hypothetical protein
MSGEADGGKAAGGRVVPAWAAFLAIAAVAGVLLHLLLETPPLEATLGAILLAALGLAPLLLWRRQGPAWLRVGVVLVPVLLLPASWVDQGLWCRLCGTFREHAAVGWGLGSDWFRIPVRSTTRTSRACEDFFGTDHEHDFRGHTDMDGILGFNSLICGGHRICGSPYWNPFGRRYNEDEAFRALVKGKVRAGEVTADEVRFLLGHRYPPMMSRIPVPPGTHALVRKAETWLGEPLWSQYGPEYWPPESPAAR